MGVLHLPNRRSTLEALFDDGGLEDGRKINGRRIGPHRQKVCPTSTAGPDSPLSLRSRFGGSILKKPEKPWAALAS